MEEKKVCEGALKALRLQDDEGDMLVAAIKLATRIYKHHSSPRFSPAGPDDACREISPSPSPPVDWFLNRSV